MPNTRLLLPLALLALTAFPAAAQEMPLVLFCQGQCFGIDEAGKRVPATKGTRLAPGLRLETGADSYAQVRLGPDTACGIGERSRVRFDHRTRDKDVVILDQGRIRLIGGEAIGRPGLRPVELHTVDGKFDLKSADIEVKSLPKTADAPAAPTLVKLNIGEARLGDLPVTKEAVQGISGGKILERAIPIGDIALAPRQVTPAKTGEPTAPSVRQPIASLPVISLPATEIKPIAEPVKVSPAIMSPELLNSSLLIASPTLSRTAISTALISDPAQTIKPYVPPVSADMMVKAYPIETASGTTSLDQISRQLQLTQSTAPTTSTTSTTSPTSTINQTLLTQTLTLSAPTTTTTSTATTTTPILLSPKLTTTKTLTLR